jgi:thioredoxin-related protein
MRGYHTLNTVLIAVALLMTAPLSAQMETIKWYTIEQAEAIAKKEKRKIVIDVYTNWCNNCKAMDKNTFSQQQIAKYVNENFIPVRLDAEEHSNISFRNKTYHFVQNGNVSYNELAMELINNQTSYPTIVFLDENLKVIQALQGYKMPDQFEKILKYFGSEYHKQMPWTKFERTYPNVTSAKNR